MMNEKTDSIIQDLEKIDCALSKIEHGQEKGILYQTRGDFDVLLDIILRLKFIYHDLKEIDGDLAEVVNEIQDDFSKRYDLFYHANYPKQDRNGDMKYMLKNDDRIEAVLDILTSRKEN